MNKALLFLLIFTCSLPGFGQTADFSYQSNSGYFCSPSTIKFTKITTGSPVGYIWNFGNNAGSNQENPVYTYQNPGTYTVKLIVIYKKFTRSVSKNIIINQGVSVQLSSNRTSLCTPGNIIFQTTSNTAISNYEWTFGDNSAIVSTSSSSVNHLFSDFGNYAIMVKAISATGCSGKSTGNIAIQKPTLSATATSLFGCVPSQVNFSASVSGISPGFVTGYSWEFNDGSAPVTTSQPYVSHFFNSAGLYSPAFHITTSEGCSQEFNYNEMAFGIPPTNLVAYPTRTVFCGSESVPFIARASNANKYFWDFSDGDTLSVTDTVVRHKFKRLGVKTVKVTPYYNGCMGETRSFTIEVIGTIAGFSYSNTCSDKKTFTLNNQSQGNQSGLKWQFGDGSPILESPAVIHTYPDTGIYNTRLTIWDNITGCSDTYPVDIYTANPVLINPDQSLCRNNTTSFTIQHNYNNPRIKYNWNVIGLHEEMSSANPFSVRANHFGIYGENMVIIDNGPQYCRDSITLSHNIIVRGPILDFNAAPDICISHPYTVTNLSKSFIPADQITEWNWDFGIPVSNSIINNFQPPPVNYIVNGTAFWGNYNVLLTARDMNGCMDSLTKHLLVKDIPFLRSIPDLDTICAGEPAKLIAFHNDGISWWPNTNINCVHCDTVTVSPLRTTQYYVTATNQYNCSVTDTIPVYVHEPFTASVLNQEYSFCKGAFVQFDVNPKNKMVTWSPPDGLSNVNSFSPLASPGQSTLYKVILRDSASCFSSSADIRVTVKSLPTVNAGSDRIYPYHTEFTLAPVYSSNTREYEWSPAGSLSCAQCPTPNGIITESTRYYIKVTSDSGCVSKDEINIRIECKGANLLLPTAFTPNQDYLNDYFYPITRGIKKVIRFAIYNRQGQMVFEAKDFYPNDKLKGWDGKINGIPQSGGTYVYLLDTTCDSGEFIQKKGSFMLIR